MSTMAQERMMAEEADRAADAVAAREAAADKALRTIEKAEPAVPGPVVPKVIRNVDGVCDKCAAPLMKEDGTPTARAWRTIAARLQQEMPSKSRAGRGGKTFDYVNARQVARRLDEVVGPSNWSTQVQVVRADHPVSVLVTLSIFGVSKTDAGYSNNPEADDESDKSYELEPLKAAVSDGFKRAAVQWGVGRFLYGD